VVAAGIELEKLLTCLLSWPFLNIDEEESDKLAMAVSGGLLVNELKLRFEGGCGGGGGVVNDKENGDGDDDNEDEFEFVAAAPFVICRFVLSKAFLGSVKIELKGGGLARALVKLIEFA